MNIQKAIDYAGSQAALARLLGVTRAYVSLMAKEGAVSAPWACKIEIATEGACTRMDMRPDLFGDLNSSGPA